MFEIFNKGFNGGNTGVGFVHHHDKFPGIRVKTQGGFHGLCDINAFHHPGKLFIAKHFEFFEIVNAAEYHRRSRE